MVRKRNHYSYQVPGTRVPGLVASTGQAVSPKNFFEDEKVVLEAVVVEVLILVDFVYADRLHTPSGHDVYFTQKLRSSEHTLKYCNTKGRTKKFVIFFFF